jgi:transposase-like protein
MVEADETFIGRKEGEPIGRSGYHHKNPVLTLIDRATGEARSFHIDSANAESIIPIVRQNVAREAAITTDEASHYNQLNRDYFHASVNHGKEEWAVGEFHTNTAEGYFSIFKRGMKGIYQHCREKHLHRYLAEFDFRYSNRSALGVEDLERAERALRGVVGRRLTYRKRSQARTLIS